MFKRSWNVITGNTDKIVKNVFRLADDLRGALIWNSCIQLEFKCVLEIEETNLFLVLGMPVSNGICAECGTVPESLDVNRHLFTCDSY